MRLIAWFVPLLLLAAPLYYTDGEAKGSILANEEKYVEILYTFDPPNLDGYIDPEEWQAQFTINYYDAFDGESFREIYPETGSDEEFSNQTDIAVTFYMLYDDTYLYFAANVTDDNIIIDSGSTFWRDDGIELMIDGAHDKDEDQRADDPWPGFEDGTTLLAIPDGSYFHDYSVGTPYERSFGPDSDWYAVTRMAPSSNYYIVEMRVRLDAVSSPSPNSTIGLNIGVNDDDTGGLSKTALKWTGKENETGENPTFKNETLWGTAYLKPYVNARLPERISVDEDVEITISSNMSTGNHPDFDTESNYTWTLPLYDGFSWNNYTSHGKDFVYTFLQPRSFYILNLEMTDPSNVTDKTSTYVYVYDVTPPLIVQEDGVAFEEVPYNFILNVTDNVGIKRVNWSLYDDGWRNISTIAPFFDHTFQHPGNYTLFYTAYDLENNSAGGSSLITVLDNAPPLITGTLPDISINTSDTLDLTSPYAFDDTDQGPDTELIYEWFFHGPFGTFTFNGKVISIDIPIPGDYNSTLRVTDKIGLQAEIIFNLTVFDDTKPIPAFPLPTEADEGTVIELNANDSLDNDPDFWDGSFFNWTIELTGKTTWTGYREGNVSAVVFPFPGTATITLKIVDPAGNNATLTKSITILDATPPKARLWFDPDAVDQNQQFYLNITGTLENVEIISVHYTIYRITLIGMMEVYSTPFFGVRVGNITPENYSKLNDLWITLNEPGEYLINVTVEDSSGLVDNASRTIKVRDSVAPEAVINKTIEYLALNEPLYLSGSDSSDEYGPLTFQWLIDNDTILGEGPSLFHMFLETGEYNITLKVTDSGGNMDTALCRVIVKDPAEEVQGEGTDYTLAYALWSTTGAIILIGLIILFLWARRKKGKTAERTEEE